MTDIERASRTYLVASNMDTTDRHTKHEVAGHHAADPASAAHEYQRAHPNRTTGEHWAIYVLDFARVRFEGTLTRHGWKPSEPPTD
jgi:hypothetical protein